MIFKNLQELSLKVLNILAAGQIFKCLDLNSEELRFKHLKIWPEAKNLKT